jgi:hypothetical protein
MLRLRLNNRPAKNLLAGLLICVLVFASGVRTALAASVEEQIKEHTDGSTSSEYYAFTKMWSEYFLDLLPTNAEPESLQRLTALPAYDDTEGWDDFFHKGDPIKMRDEAFFLANELGMTNPDLSLEEKMENLAEWLFYEKDYADQRVFSWYGDVDGYRYDCNTQSEGYVAVCRIAGIPSVSTGLYLRGIAHAEPFYYDGNAWRHMDSELTMFNDYFKNIDAQMINDPILYAEDAYVLGVNKDYILDVNESRIGLINPSP